MNSWVLLVRMQLSVQIKKYLLCILWFWGWLVITYLYIHDHDHNHQTPSLISPFAIINRCVLLLEDIIKIKSFLSDSTILLPPWHNYETTLIAAGMILYFTFTIIFIRCRLSFDFGDRLHIAYKTLSFVQSTTNNTTRSCLCLLNYISKSLTTRYVTFHGRQFVHCIVILRLI